MDKQHNQLNISGFPNTLRIKLEHLAVDHRMKLNRYIIHELWKVVNRPISESDKFVCAEKEKA